jgi:hypothetical protein
LKYTNEYQADILSKFKKQFTGEVEIDDYSVEIDGYFNEPPVRQVCRLMDMIGEKNGTDEYYDYVDLMTHYAVLGKPVKIYLGNEVVISFVLNNLNDDWTLVPAFNDHPRALTALYDIVLSFLLKKYVLPVKVKAKAPEVGKAN